jgi:hypothetical protein
VNASFSQILPGVMSMEEDTDSSLLLWSFVSEFQKY